MPFDYCQCCKFNFENGRGHIYSKKHIKRLAEWSERQKKRVSDCLLLAQEGYGNKTIENHSFWCAFCGEEIIDHAPLVVYIIPIGIICMSFFERMVQIIKKLIRNGSISGNHFVMRFTFVLLAFLVCGTL